MQILTSSIYLFRVHLFQTYIYFKDFLKLLANDFSRIFFPAMDVNDHWFPTFFRNNFCCVHQKKKKCMFQKHLKVCKWQVYTCTLHIPSLLIGFIIAVYLHSAQLFNAPFILCVLCRIQNSVISDTRLLSELQATTYCSCTAITKHDSMP